MRAARPADTPRASLCLWSCGERDVSGTTPFYMEATAKTRPPRDRDRHSHADRLKALPLERAPGSQFCRGIDKEPRLRCSEWNWGRSSAGRASRWHCEGQGFDPPRLHQNGERSTDLTSRRRRNKVSVKAAPLRPGSPSNATTDVLARHAVIKSTSGSIQPLASRFTIEDGTAAVRVSKAPRKLPSNEGLQLDG